MRSLWILVVAVGGGLLWSGSTGETPWDTLSPTTTLLAPECARE